MVRMVLVSLLWAFSVANVAQAQISDVPSFEANGDFLSARVRGHRGTYPHWQWLVIEPDLEGLNCRHANGDTIVTLAYGTVVDSVFENDDAIALVNGQPWLRVSASSLDIRRQVIDQAAETYTCYIRANTRYIAPINPDAQ